MFCPECGGSGYFWDWDKDEKDTFVIECSFCNGAGEVSMEKFDRWIKENEEDEAQIRNSLI